MRKFAIALCGLSLSLSPFAEASSFKLQYGGRLSGNSGRPVVGPISLTLNFFHSASGGAIIAGQTFNSVPLTDGLFALSIDLPAADYNNVFSSAEVWVEVTDATNGKIYPRQKFGAVPYALRVPVDGTTLSFSANGELQLSGIKGSPLPVGNPSDGQVLKWKDGTGWEWGSAGGGGAASIDSTAIQDGTISDADLAAGAAIAGTKIAPNFGTQNITTTGTISGDGSGLTNLPAGPLGNSIESSEIADGTIVNVDIAAGAAIDQSKISGLSAALSAREPAIPAGTSAQYLRGDKSWATLDTAAIPENTNLYFTEARARAAVSATAPLAYSPATGVISLPAATSVANGYLSAGDWLTFNSKQAAVTAASTVNTGTLTSALQIGLQLEPFGTNSGETGELRFKELTASGSNYIGFKAPSSLAGDLVYVLPPADGSGGQFLSTDGSGNLTWGSVAGGAGGTVTSVTAGTGLSGGTITGSGTINLANTAVGAGSYTRANITVDAQGRLTAAANGASVNLTSEVTGALPLLNGGTGATTASDARSSLGLGGLATLNAVGSTEVSDDTIVNADISASAAIVDSKLATIATAGKVSNSATTATSSNTNSAIVARDGSGNFSAGTITATLDGNASTATTAGNVTGMVAIANGGTGATTAALARTALGLGSLATVSSVDLATAVTSVLPIANGGTGATTAALARTALGLGSLATVSSVDLAAGVTGALPIANGGTGATTAALARTSLALGDLATLNAVGSAEITNDSIANADIAAAAAIVDTKLATISTAGKVSNSATTATNANTANAIVARDASGNFTAGLLSLATGAAFPDGKTQAIAAGQSYALISRSTTRSIVNGTNTQFGFPTEDADTDNYFSPGTSDEVINIPATGVYMIGIQVEWENSNAGTQRLLRVLHNGSNSIIVRTAPAEGTAQNGSRMIVATAGDTLTFTALQNSGGTLNLNCGLCYFWIMRIK